jgi:type II secretory pathway component PulM
MQLQQQEVEALRKKPIPSPLEAQSLIHALSKQHFGSTPIGLPGQGLQVQLNGVNAERLALGWQEIRAQTSASVVRVDLTASGPLWSGTLVFKLAQKP